jgi:hypothetical protein
MSEIRDLRGSGEPVRTSVGDLRIFPCTVGEMLGEMQEDFPELQGDFIGYAIMREESRPTVTKWLQRKVKKDDQPVTLEMLNDLPLDELGGLMKVMFEISGFPLPS